jgi:hypothetical protein
VDADWSMQDGRYDQSPDPDDEDNGFPHGLRKEMRPGNTTKLFDSKYFFQQNSGLCVKMADLHVEEAAMFCTGSCM